MPECKGRAPADAREKADEAAEGLTRGREQSERTKQSSVAQFQASPRLPKKMASRKPKSREPGGARMM
eukprot:1631804-Alexandrium_andersonii.AAC.1